MSEVRPSNAALIDALTIALGAVFAQLDDERADIVICLLQVREDAIALDPNWPPEHAQALGYVRRRLSLVATALRDAERAQDDQQKPPDLEPPLGPVRG